MSGQQITLTTKVALNDGKHHMPQFGLGTWRSEPEKVTAAVAEAIKAGYIHLDCAFAYENHPAVAKGIKEGLAATGKSREDIWVTTKLWNTHHNPDRVESHVDGILSDLQLDYVDQLLIHWPVSWEVPTEGNKLFPKPAVHDKSHSHADTWKAMEKLVHAGKVRTLGISNFNEDETNEILASATIKPVVNQVESHPFFNNNGLRQFLKTKNIEFVAYSPLGNVGGNADESPLATEPVKKLAQKYNKTPAQVIIRWHLDKGHIVIPKSSSPDRVRENAQVFDFSLTPEEVASIDQLDKGPAGRQVNPPFLVGGKKNFPEA